MSSILHIKFLVKSGAAHVMQIVKKRGKGGEKGKERGRREGERERLRGRERERREKRREESIQRG